MALPSPDGFRSRWPVAAQSDAVGDVHAGAVHQAEPQGVSHGGQQGDAREGAHRGIGDGAEADGRHGREKPVEKNLAAIIAGCF